jgi:hypothetical protein
MTRERDWRSRSLFIVQEMAAKALGSQCFWILSGYGYSSTLVLGGVCRLGSVSKPLHGVGKFGVSTSSAYLHSDSGRISKLKNHFSLLHPVQDIMPVHRSVHDRPCASLLLMAAYQFSSFKHQLSIPRSPWKLSVDEQL